MVPEADAEVVNVSGIEQLSVPVPPNASDTIKIL